MRIRIKTGPRRLLKWAADLLILAGAAALLVYAWARLDGTYYQYSQQLQFESESEAAGTGRGIEEEIAVPAARPQSQPNPRLRLLPSLPSLMQRDPLLIGKLEVPRLGLSVMVREGVDEETLRRAAGHVPSTALPGQPGNLVILAHRDTYFRGLHDLQRGDAVTVTTLRGRFTYQIESIEVVDPEGIRLEQPASASIATFITCFPFKYIGPAPQRFVARARLKKQF